MTDTTTETTTPAAQLERYTRFWNTGPDAERDRLAAGARSWTAAAV